MQVDFFPASELDANVKSVEGNCLEFEPLFYQAKGPALLGTLQVTDKSGNVLDRAILNVSGNGKISVVHRNNKVVPIADCEKGDKKDGGSTKSKSSPKPDIADVNAHPSQTG